MDMEPWHAAVDGVTKSQTQLSDWTELYCVYLYVSSHANTHYKYYNKLH